MLGSTMNNGQTSISTHNSERKNYHRIVFQPTDLNPKIYEEQQTDEKEIMNALKAPKTKLKDKLAEVNIGKSYMIE